MGFLTPPPPRLATFTDGLQLCVCLPAALATLNVTRQQSFLMRYNRLLLPFATHLILSLYHSRCPSSFGFSDPYFSYFFLIYPKMGFKNGHGAKFSRRSWNLSLKYVVPWTICYNKIDRHFGNRLSVPSNVDVEDRKRALRGQRLKKRKSKV